MTTRGDRMTASQILSEMEKKLDELISNANLLRECEEDNGESRELEHRQEMLLNSLLKISSSLDDEEKIHLLQKSPHLYFNLEKKAARLSRANMHLLRTSKERLVKKARVHRRKIKRPPTQLTLDLN
jgi:ribosomal protein L9